jgi:6-phosphogluconolactonase
MKSYVFTSLGLVMALGLSACTNGHTPKAPPSESAANTSGDGSLIAKSQATSTDNSVAPLAPLENQGIRLYVGSGDWGTATGAISVLNYDPTTGSLRSSSQIAAGGLLSFLASDSQHGYLYAADEEQKKLRSFAIDPTDGSLTAIATVETVAGAVYVTIPRSDRFILAAQFNSGKTEVFTLDGKGGFGPQTAAVTSGKESHGVFLAPDERFAFVPGRGSDIVQVFRFDANTGSLQSAGAASLPKGAGCRHFDFHPNGRFAYLINEFANTIVAFTYDTSAGRLSELQTISTNPGEDVKSSAADIHVHPSGKFLYATNRPDGANGSIVVYAVADDGQLTFVQKESTQGRVPRNFHIVADGTRIVVGNQDSKSIISYIVDAVTGSLTPQALTPLEVKPFFVSDL